jgi:UDP-N-acetylglucosamine 2-epimerase (non-hydrolysing)
LILGDTNSALSAIIAARRGIPVFHMEAGNRCYDDRVPEEVNRRIIDHSSTYLMPYTERSKENLVREGIERERIFVTGNPIKEVLDTITGQIEASDALQKYDVKPFEYFLVTIHRAENVDTEERLVKIFRGLEKVVEKFGKKMLVSVHPRTAEKLVKFSFTPGTDKIKLLRPLGFFDFVKLEKSALAVLTDSGTVQEECAIFGVPNITIRDVTERPETVECGSNIVSGAEDFDGFMDFPFRRFYSPGRIIRLPAQNFDAKVIRQTFGQSCQIIPGRGFLRVIQLGHDPQSRPSTGF